MKKLKKNVKQAIKAFYECKMFLKYIVNLEVLVFELSRVDLNIMCIQQCSYMLAHRYYPKFKGSDKLCD